MSSRSNLELVFCAHDRPNYINGPNVWLVRLVSELASRGHRVHVLVQHSYGPGPLLRALADLDVAVDAIERPSFTEDRVRWILDRVAAAPPDVFIPNLSVAGFYAGRWARASGIPTVGVLHSDDAFHWGLVDEFVNGLEDFRVSAMVCVSRYLTERLEESSPPGLRARRIPYGVPTPDRAAAWRQGRFRLVFVGRLVQEQKRILEVTAAMCRAARDVPGVEGVLIGDGPDRRAIARMLARHAACPIQLAGRMESDQVVDALVDGQALVLLSDFEGLPIALMEAMSCGVVPICLRTRSGIDELITDRETGLLVEDRDDAFVEAVRLLASDRELWQRLSAGARARIHADYSIEGNADRWLDLLRELVGGAPAPARFAIPSVVSLPPVRAGLEREDVRRQPMWRLALTRGLWRATRVLRRRSRSAATASGSDR